MTKNPKLLKKADYEEHKIGNEKNWFNNFQRAEAKAGRITGKSNMNLLWHTKNHTDCTDLHNAVGMEECILDENGNPKWVKCDPK